MTGWYDLDGKPINAEAAGRLLADANARRVARTIITTDRGQVEVSTMFLVMDHGWGSGPPVLWETMIFGGPEDEYQDRYNSRAEAEAGHQKTVTRCRAALEADGATIIAEETVESVSPNPLC